MKRLITVIILLALCTTTNALSADKKDACLRVLGAGIYNHYLEAHCGFNGGVSAMLNTMYTEGGCRSIVEQNEVDSTIKEVFDDSDRRLRAMGKNKFCIGNKKAYYDLANPVEKRPNFKKGESYASVRTKMIKAGWKPFHSEDADTCSAGDSRCTGRPEMQSCSGTGLANCRFLWKKDGKMTAICTVGEENAVFDNFCD